MRNEAPEAIDFPEGHKAGFVNIVGSPNVGKSTLMNRLVGENISIINSKAQTTRHRIMGIVNQPEFQIVYSDTPGVLDPAYKLQEGMMRFVKTALQDADVLILVTDIFEEGISHEATFDKIAKMDIPVFILINKVDLADQERAMEKAEFWQKKIPRAHVAPISALHNFNLENLLDRIVEELPVAPPFFPKDELTDKPMRFFVSEIVREKILTHYKQEIPYSCEVVVEEFIDEPTICRIRAEIRVARESQKYIVVGAGGRMIKRVGTDSRKELESFLDKKVFLDLYVRVDKDWRNDERKLKRFGYFD
ncbi:MAG TPA: GTPase Era [Flavobacteriales bacterium]|jgi:GTP-binding protein Era|nr:GTPase Era [Flavobacteriales bacterium]HIO16589.1 GTPase Era [Flavobacteriales bacterium]HIO58677.1 GTPase Era [Flavobacteriales bacterium]